MKATVIENGIKLTSTGTAVVNVLPWTSAQTMPLYVRVSATESCYVKVSRNAANAMAGDLMVQPGDAVTLCVAGMKHISAISVSGTATVFVVPLEDGIGLASQPTLNLDLTNPSTLSVTNGQQNITFTRADTASAATYFGSDGLLKVADRNLLTYSEQFDNAAWTKSNSFVQTNLLTYSEQFDNAAWTKSNATVTANAIAAPRSEEHTSELQSH